MALQVWLPLNGNLNNQGIDNTTVTNSGAVVDNNGKIGKCYSFSGSSAKITNTLSSSVASAVGTMSCWVKFNSFPASGAWYCLMQLGTTGGFANCRLGLYMQYQTDIVVCINGSSDNNLYKHSLTTNQWYHLCTTFDGTTVRLYIDGVEVWNKTAVVGSYTTAASTLFVGGTNNYYFKGYMNDVRYYSTALSPKEIEILSRGLVCHYPLNGNGRSGENLYTEPYWKYSTTKWGYAAQVGTVKPVLNTDGSVTFTGGGGTNSQCYIHHISNRVAISASTTYTVSCKVTASGSGTFKIYLYQYNSSGAKVGNTITTTHSFVDGETKTISNTITTTSTTASFYAELNMYGSPTTSTMLLHANSLKIEKSDHPTPWMPNSADTAYTSMGYNSTTEYDVSGNGYNGTKNGTFAYDIDTPRYSVCTKCSGSNYVSLTSPSSEIRTISFWGKWDSIPSGQSILFVDGESKTGFGLASNGIICSSNNITTYTFNKSVLVANTWYHFVVVCPNGGSNASRKLYINGVEQTATSNQNYWSYSLNQLQIGKRSTSSDGLVGKMSDFRAYATALSATQVAELYNTAVSVANNGTLMGYELVEG